MKKLGEFTVVTASIDEVAELIRKAAIGNHISAYQKVEGLDFREDSKQFLVYFGKDGE